LPKEAISVFSIQTDNKEEPVLCVESDNCAFASFVRDINRAVSQAYKFSFSDIVFVRKNTFPRTDNRKIKTNVIKQLYEQNKLDVLYSTKTAHTNATDEIDETASLSENASLEEIKYCVRKVFQSFTGHIGFDDNTLFTDLGTNSLTIVEMLSKLEHQSGIEIDIRQITSTLTVNDLAHHIQLALRGERHNQTDLSAECILEDGIRPQRSYAIPPEQGHNIFLTGSTGFLGAYLIKSLIKQSKDENITIFCHVRAENQQKAMERIINNMQFFHCWEETFKDKIVAIPGDLKKPNLGIENELYVNLCNLIDTVYHNGAILNFLFSYNHLKQTNVNGTIECLRFACTGNPKYFHYISSYSVYDNPSHFSKICLESDPLLSSEGYFLGYSETKWVAEKLVAEAATRGLQITVYRPGEITASLNESVWKLEDMVSRTIVGCIQMSAAPNIDINLPLTPVDYVSDVIIHLSRQTKALGKHFNVINKKTTTIKSIGEFIKKAGYTLEILPYDEWTKKLSTYAFEENALSILSRLFTDKRREGEGLTERYGSRQARLDTSNTDTLLEGSGIICPSINEKDFSKYLEIFAEKGHISKNEK
jgi:thioester reductase-like protein